PGVSLVGPPRQIRLASALPIGDPVLRFLILERHLVEFQVRLVLEIAFQRDVGLVHVGIEGGCDKRDAWWRGWVGDHWNRCGQSHEANSRNAEDGNWLGT